MMDDDLEWAIALAAADDGDINMQEVEKMQKKKNSAMN